MNAKVEQGRCGALRRMIHKDWGLEASGDWSSAVTALTVLQGGSLGYARDDDDAKRYQNSAALRETLIQSLSDFTLGFLYMTRNSLTRIASYLRKVMTKSCIKILVKSDSAIESAFP